VRGTRYLCYLVFQLKTHKDVFDDNGDSSDAHGGDLPALSLSGALVLLAGITVIVAVCSECAVDPRPMHGPSLLPQAELVRSPFFRVELFL
jgi:hypothetical protein